MNSILSFRVWDKKNNKYIENCTLGITNFGKLLISKSYFVQHFEEVDLNNYILDYCTGYKDVDGKYLYVNDYVEFQLGLKRIRCRILYDHFGFKLAEIRGGYMDFTQQKYTLIGNYHDSKPD